VQHHSDSSSEITPITKVGGVVMRVNAQGEYEFLICQPKGKGTKPGLPPMGLPRGTRQYRDAVSGKWVDAPRDSTPLPQGVEWEMPEQTLAKELWEEAGIAPEILATQQVTSLGVRVFGSVSKTPYLIHWFLVALDEAAQAAQAAVDAAGDIQDSHGTRWVTRAAMWQLTQQLSEEAERVSSGYLAVIDRVLAQLPPR
jgi:hypothetical protein